MVISVYQVELLKATKVFSYEKIFVRRLFLALTFLDYFSDPFRRLALTLAEYQLDFYWE